LGGFFENRVYWMAFLKTEISFDFYKTKEISFVAKRSVSSLLGRR
jgi:hypothetical protein